MNIMTNRVKFGMIGTSNIAEAFLRGASKVQDFELVSVYSRDLNKAKIFGKKYGAKLFFDDVEEMASSPEIDAVYIASPNALHCNQAILFMNHRKHVLCEKAFASNSKEVRQMIDVAKENKVVLMEAMKSTQLPNFKIIQENLHKIGKIRRYFGSYCQYSSRYDKLKSGIVENAFKRELSNGALMDIGIYCIYPMVVLFGKPEYVKGEAYRLETGVDGEGAAVFKYAEMDGVIQYSKIANSYIPSEIQGEEGTMIIDKINIPSDVTIKYREGREEKVSVPQELEEMCYEIEEFIGLIKDGKEESVNNSHYNSLKVMEIMEEIRHQIGLYYIGEEAR